MLLRDIMRTNVECVRPDDDLAEAEQYMRRRGIHHLVVVDRHEVVGILTLDEAERRLAEDVSRVSNAMYRHLRLGAPEMSVAEAAALLRGRIEGALPVVDGRQLVGLVTLSDLLDLLATGAAPAAGRRQRAGPRATGPAHHRASKVRTS
jgi:acetoin utilization protein AcuB